MLVGSRRKHVEYGIREQPLHTADRRLSSHQHRREWRVAITPFAAERQTEPPHRRFARSQVCSFQESRRLEFTEHSFILLGSHPPRRTACSLSEFCCREPLLGVDQRVEYLRDNIAPQVGNEILPGRQRQAILDILEVHIARFVFTPEGYDRLARRHNITRQRRQHTDRLSIWTQPVCEREQSRDCLADCPSTIPVDDPTGQSERGELLSVFLYREFLWRRG
jgi:hypothetical protein